MLLCLTTKPLRMSDMRTHACMHTFIAVCVHPLIKLLIDFLCTRIFAIGPKLYLRSNWNKMDVIVTALSVLNVLYENLAENAVSFFFVCWFECV